MLVEKARGALRLAALDANAARLGLRTGMALTEARAVLPGLLTGEAAPEADADLLAAAASACEMFTPLLALRGNEGLLLDITGCAHLFGGEVGLGTRATRRLQRLGLTVRAAIAGTPQAAWALAREKPGTVTRPGPEEETLLRGLPLAVLEQDAETTLALQRAGFRSLGDLDERPSHMLSARFGEALPAALRRVLGREDLRLTPLRLPPEIMAEKHFPEPVTGLEALLEALRTLAGDAMAALERRGAGGRAFEAAFFRSDGEVRRVSLETAQGLRDAVRLVRLLELRIDALADPLDPGFGFDALRLAVLRSDPLTPQQSQLDGSSVAAAEAAEVAALVDRLMARFGREAVQRHVARDTHDPALAAAVVPYLSAAAGASWELVAPGGGEEQVPLRPLTLFRQPQPIEVMAEVPDSPPLRFRWRHVLHEVTRAEGPERIAPDWWRLPLLPGAQHLAPVPVTRDYYRVEDARGLRFWLFREGFYEDPAAPPRWFLHGLFA